MFITEKEFESIIAKNPHLKIQQEKDVKEVRSAPYIKYWNVKVFVFEDGFVCEDKQVQGHGQIAEVFDSRREYARYLQLKALSETGRISNLSRQTTLQIQPAFMYKGEKIKAITYQADFTYIENGNRVIEDVKAYDNKTGKSRMTEAFKLKWKILKHNYPEMEFRIF